MDREELNDKGYFAARSPRDDELIEKYCLGIEERIRAAKDRNDAKQIAGDACRGFEQQCESEIIPLFLTRHVRELFEKYWGGQP